MTWTCLILLGLPSSGDRQCTRFSRIWRERDKENRGLTPLQTVNMLRSCRESSHVEILPPTAYWPATRSVALVPGHLCPAQWHDGATLSDVVFDPTARFLGARGRRSAQPLWHRCHCRIVCRWVVE